MKKITLVGAGLVGTYLAIRLSQCGYQVEIFEKRSDPRKNRLDVGRSINLALSTRGIRALEKINLHEGVLKDAVPLFGRFVHEDMHEGMIQPYGLTSKDCIYSISRGRLNNQLLDATILEHIKINFSHKLIDFDVDNQTLRFQNEVTKKNVSHQFEILIACDGAFSTIRQCLKNDNHIDFTQHILSHGYKELLISSNEGKRLQKNYLHIWPRKKFMLIALPNFDHSFTCTLFLALNGNNSFNNLTTKIEIHRFFQEFFPELLTLIPDIAEQFLNNPVGQLNSIHCMPWHYRHILLIGDAAHAMSPFFGQGMNCSLEDSCFLMDRLEKNNHDWNKTFNQFGETRKIDTDAMTAMSYDNYREMRDDITHLKFQLQKKLEKILMEKYPSLFLPKYNMVTFTTMPYHLISYLADIQQRFFDKLLNNIEYFEETDWSQIEEFMEQYQNISKSLTDIDLFHRIE